MRERLREATTQGTKQEKKYRQKTWEEGFKRKKRRLKKDQGREGLD